MKVALIDNMNNNFFAFGRYLRDLGVDAHLYLIPNSKYEHFLPQADTFEDVSKFDWIHNFPVAIDAYNNLFLDKKKLQREFKNRYDLIVSCGLSSAFLKKASINSDVIIPYGSDLYDISVMDLKHSFKDFLRNLYWYKLGYYQRKAYKEARVLMVNLNHSRYKVAVDKLGVHPINAIVPMVYNKEDYSQVSNPKFDFLQEHDFVVFNHARQEWLSQSGTNKGSDKIIKAFAQFRKQTQFKRPILVLFEYGTDVEASKELIEKLNIQKFVRWMPKSHRKEIMSALQKADFGTDQIKKNMSGTGGTANEVLASAVALITHTNGAIEDASSLFYKAPLVDVLSTKEIVAVFREYEQNPSKYQAIATAAKQWYDENLGIGLAKKYKALFELLVWNKNVTQEDAVVRNIFKR